MREQKEPDSTRPPAPPEGSGIDPHPEREESFDRQPGSKGSAVVAVIIGAILVIVVVLHLIGAMSNPHGQ
jgi:hypothetical protein